MVAPGGPCAGAQVVYQDDNAGPHTENGYTLWIREQFELLGWKLEFKRRKVILRLKQSRGGEPLYASWKRTLAVAQTPQPCLLCLGDLIPLHLRKFIKSIWYSIYRIMFVSFWSRHVNMACIHQVHGYTLQQDNWLRVLGWGVAN